LSDTPGDENQHSLHRVCVVMLMHNTIDNTITITNLM